MLNQILQELGVDLMKRQVLLLPRDKVIHAMSLDAAGVREAMKASGYHDEFKTAWFVGMSTSGSFVYELNWHDDHTGKMEAGHIFLNYLRKEGTSNFTLLAEF